MRKKHCLLLLIAGIIVLPNLSWSQPGGGKKRGGGGWDPDMMFNGFSGGRDVIIVSELDPQKQQMVQGMQARWGISGDRITREQFKSGLDNAMRKGGGPGGPKGGPGGPPNADDLANRLFDRMDKNKDGLLSFDEMPEELQRERSEFDKNNDGFIDLTEYKAYMAARAANRGPRGNNNQGGGDPEDPNAPADSQPTKEETRPHVYRAGFLPKDLPEWFTRLDGQGDNDGQVGLWEWRKDGRLTIEQFNAMDLNGDGYITVEEYYRYRTKHPEKKDSAGEALVNGEDGAGAGQFPGMNPRGPRGPNGEGMPGVRGGGGPFGGGGGPGRGGFGPGGGFPPKGGGGGMGKGGDGGGDRGGKNRGGKGKGNG